LAALRSALDKWASCTPRSGLPLGTVVGVPVSFVDGWRVLREGAADEVRGLRSGALSELGRVLQRSTRNLRLANLSLLSSRASISSTQSRSYFRVGIISPVKFLDDGKPPPQIERRRSLCPAACPCRG
jgi:hypothetical protein